MTNKKQQFIIIFTDKNNVNIIYIYIYIYIYMLEILKIN